MNIGVKVAGWVLTLLCFPSFGSAEFSEVDTTIESFLNQQNIEGATLIVTDQDGRTLHQRNYGVNFNESTPVTLASASKWLTGATIMTLVEDGLIELDAPVSNYLSYFKNKGQMSAMTVRQMLAFTTGMPEHSDLMDNPNITQQQECQYFANNLDLLFRPGTKFHYGGLQQEIAACIAEEVTNKPFREIISTRLFKPLDMSSSKIGTLVNRQPRNIVFDSDNPLTPGGIYAPAKDLLKFVQMILNGGTHKGVQVLKPSTVNAMKTDQTFGVPKNRTIWNGSAENEWAYGLGNWVQVLNPETGSTEVESRRVLMSAGAIGTMEWVDFDLKYAAVFTLWGKAGPAMTNFDNALVNLVSDAVKEDSPSDPGNNFQIGVRVLNKSRLKQGGNAVGTIIAGPINSASFTWWKIDYDSGASGWATERSLTIIDN